MVVANVRKLFKVGKTHASRFLLPRDLSAAALQENDFRYTGSCVPNSTPGTFLIMGCQGSRQQQLRCNTFKAYAPT